MTTFGKSILIVEDNTDLLNLLKINLSDQGNEIITAQDGIQPNGKLPLPAMPLN